jgi:hypothetical protein
MTGYLFGECVVDAQRGRHVWIHLPGHALADGVDAELYRDLYAAAGTGWLERGCFDHYALIPAGDGGAVEAYFALSFGKEQAHAICDLTRLANPVPSQTMGTGSWTIRQPRLAWTCWLSGGMILQRLASACVGSVLPERLDDRRQRYAGIVDDKRRRRGWPKRWAIGVAVFFSEAPVDDDLQIGNDCATFAVVARGRTRAGEGLPRR